MTKTCKEPTKARKKALKKTTRYYMFRHKDFPAYNPNNRYHLN